MNLENLQKTWDSFAQTVPLWAVLTAGKPKDFEWDEKDFFDKGELAIKRILEHMTYTWIQPEKNLALDFGCGVGRLSINLAGHFKKVVGVDVSAHMLEHAESYSKKFNRSNCSFIHNPQCNLSVFQSDQFDFIVSMITLQHMKEEYILLYLKEFIRVLKPNGVIYFQLPDQIKKSASYDFFNVGDEPEMEMHGISRPTIIDYLESQGTKVQAVIEDDCCGPEIRSFRYIAIKKSDPNRSIEKSA